MSTTRVILDCPLPVWLVAGLGAVIWAALLVYLRKDAAGLKAAPRRWSVGLMALAGAMLIAVLLSPTLLRTWQDPRKPACAILVDGSRSMLFSDSYSAATAAWIRQRLPATTSQPEKPQRDTILQAVLTEGKRTWLAAMGKDFDVAGWRFAAEAQPLSLEGAAQTYSVAEEGYATALGEAMEQAARPMGGQRPRALVLLSDGAWNTGRDPTEVARVLGRLGVSVFTVGVGNPEPPRDAAVLDLQAPKEMLLGDELLLTAKIAATGLDSPRLTVQLLQDGQIVQEKPVVAPPSGRPVAVTFSLLPNEPGLKRYVARVPPEQGEQDESNNSASASINVLEQKIRVLLIESEPRWEFRFLRNALERDTAVEAKICLLRPGVGPIVGENYVKQPPTQKKELGDYDLFILGDVSREGLGDGFLTELADAVRYRGAAVILMAGRRGNYRSLAGTPLAKVLPVLLDSPAGSDALNQPFNAELTQDGASHLMTRLAGTSDPRENEDAWSALPAINWSASVGSLAPGATALLVHPYRLAGASKLPLLAVQNAGSGKVLFCGIEETWRWRKTVGDKYHYRFWAQAVRWMAKKQFTEGDGRGRISVSRSECGVGEKVDVEALCLDPAGFPLSNAEVFLHVRQPGGSTQKISLHEDAGGWGIYRATFVPTVAGPHVLGLIVSKYGDEPLSSTAKLDATRIDLEKNFLAQDRAMLRAIAQAGGGKYLEVQQVNELPGLLSAKAARAVLTAEYSPCRHWAFYAILAAVLAVAWLVRKRSGLA